MYKNILKGKKNGMNKGSTQKGKRRNITKACDQNLTCEHTGKNFQQILADQIQQHIKKKPYMSKLIL